MMESRVIGWMGLSLLLGLSFDADFTLAQPNVPGNFKLTIPDTFVEFDQNFLYLSTIAAQLSSDVKKSDSASALANIPGGLFLEDGPDRQALVGQRNGVCYAAFAEPADVESVADVIFSSLSSIGGILGNTTCGPEFCCPTTMEISDNLFEASYYDQLVATIQGCISLCPGGCGVVLTGNGIGGAIAQIASLALTPSIRPIVITFGQPATSELPCEGIDPTRLYRFINTIEVNNGILRYDPVPFVEFQGAKHQGRAFVFSPSFGPMATYFGDEAPKFNPDVWADDSNFEAVHSAEAYLTRLVEYVLYGIFPLPITGFLLSYPCSITSECSFPNYCAAFLPNRLTCGFVPGVPLPPTRAPILPPSPPPTLAPVPKPTPAPVPPPTAAPVFSFSVAPIVSAPTNPPIADFLFGFIDFLSSLIEIINQDVGLTENVPAPSPTSE